MIFVDLEKAKQIGHDIRRKLRSDEFAPLDAKTNIPSLAAEAETLRQAVRKKFAEIQISIDSAKNLDQIKTALGLS